MAKRTPDVKLASASQRRNIPYETSDGKAGKLHVVRLHKRLGLGYRRGLKAGTWFARRHEGGTKYSFHPLGIADDTSNADNVSILSFDQAAEHAREWSKKKAATDAGMVVSGPYTVEQVMTDYLADSERAKRKKLPHTRILIAAHIVPKLGKIDVAKLTQGRLKAWRDELATAPPRARTGFVKEKVWCVRMVNGRPKGQYRMRATEAKLPLSQAHREHDATDPETMRKRQATTNRILSVLKAALNHAHAEGKIASKTAWEALKPFKKVDVPKVRFLTKDEAKALVLACEPNFQALVRGALYTGCRYGELAAMKVEAFDAGQGTVYVAESKNGESRYVDLGEKEGLPFFTELTKGRDGKQAMFMRTDNKPWRTSEQQRPMDAACEAAKIEGVTFHILRHTYASHAVMNGMPIAVVSAQLGHKDTRITERHYAHLAQSYKKKLVQENAPSFGFGT